MLNLDFLDGPCFSNANCYEVLHVPYLNKSIRDENAVSNWMQFFVYEFLIWFEELSEL